MDVRIGLWRKLSTEELMLLNCGVGEDSWDPLDCKEIQPVHSKGDQPWVFFGWNDAKAQAPILWPADVKKIAWFIGKDPDAEKNWRQEEKGTTQDEMVGWHDHPCGTCGMTTCVWACSRSWWWTGRLGVLRSMRSRRVWQNWAAELTDQTGFCSQSNVSAF